MSGFSLCRFCRLTVCYLEITVFALVFTITVMMGQEKITWEKDGKEMVLIPAGA